MKHLYTIPLPFSYLQFGLFFFGLGPGKSRWFGKVLHLAVSASFSMEKLL